MKTRVLQKRLPQVKPYYYFASQTYINVYMLANNHLYFTTLLRRCFFLDTVFAVKSCGTDHVYV